MEDIEDLNTEVPVSWNIQKYFCFQLLLVVLYKKSSLQQQILDQFILQITLSFRCNTQLTHYSLSPFLTIIPARIRIFLEYYS